NQQDKEAVAAVKAGRFFENAFAMRADGEAVEVTGNVLAEFLDGGIARIAMLGSGFGTNRFEGAVEARGNSSGCFLREEKPQKRAEGENVAARVQHFHFAAGLFGGHVAGRAHDGAVAGDDGTF